MLQGANDPARMDRLNALLMEAAERWPDDLRVVDFAGYLREREIDLTRADIRPDGVHFEKSEAVAEIVATWLGPEVVKATVELIGIADERSRAGASRRPED